MHLKQLLTMRDILCKILKNRISKLQDESFIRQSSIDYLTEKAENIKSLNEDIVDLIDVNNVQKERFKVKSLSMTSTSRSAN